LLAPRLAAQNMFCFASVTGYAWGETVGETEFVEIVEEQASDSARFVAVLEIPPVESAVTAVRVQIVKDVKSDYSK
jgi:hypothetical protein